MRYNQLTEKFDDLLPRYKKAGIDMFDLKDMIPNYSSAKEFADKIAVPNTPTYDFMIMAWEYSNREKSERYSISNIGTLIADKLGATFSKMAREPDWETDKMIGSPEGYILGADGWRVYLDATRIKNEIWMSQILTKDFSSGLGTKIMNIIKEIADEKGLGVKVFKVTNPNFFNKFKWLKTKDNDFYQYNENTDMLGNSTKPLPFPTTTNRSHKVAVKEGVIKVPKNLAKNMELLAVGYYANYLNYILTKEAKAAGGVTTNFRAEIQKILDLYKIHNLDINHPTAERMWIDEDIGEINGQSINFSAMIAPSMDHSGQYLVKSRTVQLILSSIFPEAEFDPSLFKPDVKSNFVGHIFNHGIRKLRGTIEHELAHAVQYLKLADKDARQIDGDDEYHNKNVEFYPMIISHAHIFIGKFGDERAAKRIATKRSGEFSAAIKAYLGIGKPVVIAWGAFDLKFGPAVFFEKIRNKVGMFNFKKAAREFVKAIHASLNEPITENLTEGRDYPLYHFMDSHKGDATFSKNMMEARWVHNIPGLGKVQGNSFTRNERLTYGSIIRLTMDHAKLAQRYKIIPVDGERVFSNMNRPDGSKLRGNEPASRGGKALEWSEEFVVGDISNLNRYINKIEIMGDQWRQMISYKKFIEILIDTKAYADRFDIPFHVDLNIISKLMRDIQNERKQQEDEVDPALDDFEITLRSLVK